jgi:hypothetical protein
MRRTRKKAQGKRKKDKGCEKKIVKKKKVNRETGESEIIVHPKGGVHVCWSRDPEPARRNEKGGKDRREMVKWRAGSALNVDREKGRGRVDYRVVVVAAIVGENGMCGRWARPGRQ